MMPSFLRIAPTDRGITLVCLYISLSVCLYVSLSLNVLNIGLLVLSDSIQEDSWP